VLPKIIRASILTQNIIRTLIKIMPISEQYTVVDGSACVLYRPNTERQTRLDKIHSRNITKHEE
jgi:hypothetical protein